MIRRLFLLPLVALIIILADLIAPSSAEAQPSLISASPAPDSVLAASPTEIILTFDRILVISGTTIEITNEQGDRIETGSVNIDPANRFLVMASVPTLIEGRYTVRYEAASVGSSTRIAGSYQFTVDLPPPRLTLITPVDGQSYQTGSVTLKMGAEFFEFGLYDNRIRIYVDDGLEAEIRALEYEITGLEPGVHQITIVLAQFEAQEIPETAITVHIAVAQPDPETAGSNEAAQASGDPALRLEPSHLIATIITTLVLLGIGLWLGRMTYPG